MQAVENFGKDLIYLYENLYRDEDKCTEKGNWNAKGSKFCISYTYNAHILYPEPQHGKNEDLASATCFYE